MSGVDLRKKLGLNSNFVRFKFFEEELNNKFPMKKGLIVIGQGSGHGVGMSQWVLNIWHLKAKKLKEY